MPSSYEATFEDWIAPIEAALERVSEPAYLVGHSVGGSMLLKFLSEHHVSTAAGLFVIAAPFWGADDFWTREEALDGYSRRARGMTGFKTDDTGSSTRTHYFSKSTEIVGVVAYGRKPGVAAYLLATEMTAEARLTLDSHFRKEHWDDCVGSEPDILRYVARGQRSRAFELLLQDAY